MQTESFKHVTNRQGIQFAKFARESGVSRKRLSEFFNDEEKRNKFFDELKNGDDWRGKLQMEANKIGASIHFLKVRVDSSKTHNEAAMLGGPQTGSDYNVLKVGDEYPKSENKIVDEFLVLLNYPQGDGNYQKTVEWGIKNGLEKSVPHEVFAIGEQFPKLNDTLGLNPMYVVETTGCSFDGSAHACCVCWRDAKRKSFLDWQGNFGDSYDWFAFRKKISPKDLETLVS